MPKPQIFENFQFLRDLFFSGASLPVFFPWDFLYRSTKNKIYKLKHIAPERSAFYYTFPPIVQLPPVVYIPVDTLSIRSNPFEVPTTTKLLFAGTKAQHKTSQCIRLPTTRRQIGAVWPSACTRHSLIVASNDDETIRSFEMLQSIPVTPFLCPSSRAITFGGSLVVSHIEIVPSRDAQQSFDLSLLANFKADIEALWCSKTWCTPANAKLSAVVRELFSGKRPALLTSDAVAPLLIERRELNDDGASAISP